MLCKWLRASAVLVGAIGLSSLSSSVQATPRELTGKDSQGNVVSSGWTWDVSAAEAPLVNLVWIRTEGNNFFFEKDAQFVRASDPIVIKFTRIDPNAKTLVINDENITNNTGEDWVGFRMELSSGNVGDTPNFAFTSHDGAPGIGDFSIDPFTSFTFYNNNAGLLVNGGTVKTGSTWFPGSQSNTGLAIIANLATAATFSLKEIPVTIIPIPAAVWTGLSTMLFLGAVQGLRRVRRIG
jgi:hypothetical protein